MTAAAASETRADVTTLAEEPTAPAVAAEPNEATTSVIDALKDYPLDAEFEGRRPSVPHRAPPATDWEWNERTGGWGLRDTHDDKGRFLPGAEARRERLSREGLLPKGDELVPGKIDNDPLGLDFDKAPRGWQAQEKHVAEWVNRINQVDPAQLPPEMQARFAALKEDVSKSQEHISELAGGIRGYRTEQAKLDRKYAPRIAENAFVDQITDPDEKAKAREMIADQGLQDGAQAYIDDVHERNAAIAAETAGVTEQAEPEPEPNITPRTAGFIKDVRSSSRLPDLEDRYETAMRMAVNQDERAEIEKAWKNRF